MRMNAVDDFLDDRFIPGIIVINNNFKGYFLSKQ